MPKAWLCIPSMRDADSSVTAWEAKGYGIALFRDRGAPDAAADLLHQGDYPGYAKAVNLLAADVLRADSDTLFIVAAGDDTFPDSRDPDQIVDELTAHFCGTFGVCQPTGDSWADRNGKLIERVAGSPFLGREWCLRANQGKGPLSPGFFHMWCDEALQETAKLLGVFWQRPDLTHHHEHWGRPRPGERIGQLDRMPKFLARANSTAQTNLDKAEFDRLKAGGFKECFPL